MNNKHKKVVAATIGLAVMAAAAAPLAMPSTAAAKWFSWTKAIKVQADAPSDTAVKTIEPSQPVDVQPADVKEAVVTTSDGVVERIQIVETEAKQPVTVAVDTKTTEEMQSQADNGLYAWMLNPLEVVRHNADKYGFSDQDTYTLLSQTYKGNSGRGEAQVLVGHNGKYYRVYLIQPTGVGAKRIWVVSGIGEVKVIKSSHKHPDVGPGVEGLDYSKVIKWQQNVDEGRELWRLDPLQVARNEGKDYGFTDKAVFTITKRVSSSPIARHGQIDVEVRQNGKTYTMILVRPFGSDDGAIWTVYRVTGVDKPDQQPLPTKVLFETDKYAAWKWYKGQSQYPKDSAFATIVDYDAQLKYDKRIPEYVLERVKDVDYDSKAVLLAYLGTAPSGGYGIGIEKVTMTGNNITVQVQTKSPAPNEMVTMAITHPADYITIDRSIVDIWGGVNVTFIDQYGSVLSKNKLVISHRN